MKILYSPEYNIDLGVLNALHPFDGRKYRKVYDAISDDPRIEIESPRMPIDEEAINAFVNPLMRRLIKGKRYVLHALELPDIPLISFSMIDRHILAPMRWAVEGTRLGAEIALAGESCRNLSGGYHHASRQSAEGFCIYNDIGIAYDSLIGSGRLTSGDRVLIVDVDAHHGNGNAYVFAENPSVTLLDMYNASIYPDSFFTRARVNIAVQLEPGTTGETYLHKLDDALGKIDPDHVLAFVVAGTDVLKSDSLGQLGLSIEECAQRDQIIAERLADLSIPSVFLAGGGYSRESSQAMIAAIEGTMQSIA